MKNKYSFLKLLLAQWSWKNDRGSVIFYLALALAYTPVVLIFGTITDNSTGKVVDFNILEHYYLFTYVLLCSYLWFLGVYQFIKLVLMVLFTGLTTYSANKGKIKAVAIYNEALTWRQ